MEIRQLPFAQSVLWLIISVEKQLLKNMRYGPRIHLVGPAYEMNVEYWIFFAQFYQRRPISQHTRTHRFPSFVSLWFNALHHEWFVWCMRCVHARTNRRTSIDGLARLESVGGSHHMDARMVRCQSKGKEFMKKWCELRGGSNVTSVWRVHDMSMSMGEKASKRPCRMNQSTFGTTHSN